MSRRKSVIYQMMLEPFVFHLPDILSPSCSQIISQILFLHDHLYLFFYQKYKNFNLILAKPVETKEYKVDWGAIIEKASARALGSGGAGATAMVIQVCSLMWMRTIMNYQVG